MKPQAEHHYDSCLSKVRYRSESQAQAAANRRPIGLRIYQCPLCHGYHLTKRLESPAILVK